VGLFVAVLLAAAQGEQVPGTLVRWPAAGATACAMEGRAFAPLGDQCYFPVDLLQAPGPVELVRVGAQGREVRRPRVGPYPYQVQTLTLPGWMVDLGPQELAQVAAEEARVAALWERPEGPALFRLPLGRPLDRLPAGGRFGARRIINGEPRNPHSGVDYAAPAGTPVRAVAQGRVVLAEDHFFAGRSVFVDHGAGLVSMYFHLARRKVAVGEAVSRGQVLGTVGSSGRATGPHLHFGLRWHGARIDPRPLLGPPARIPTLAGTPPRRQ